MAESTGSWPWKYQPGPEASKAVSFDEEALGRMATGRLRSVLNLSTIFTNYVLTHVRSFIRVVFNDHEEQLLLGLNSECVYYLHSQIAGSFVIRKFHYQFGRFHPKVFRYQDILPQAWTFNPSAIVTRKALVSSPPLHCSYSYSRTFRIKFN